ncbi:hypothetical protein Dimus_031705 [Dionaea muscipula]
MVKALPIDLIWRKRVIRCKIVRESQVEDNDLTNVMDLIQRQRWEKLFKRRELVHVDVVKEFYARMTLIYLKKKDVVKSSVRGVAIEFDHLKLASILGIPGNNGICEYIQDVWEESKYTKPLEIIRKFANDETIMEARRVKSVEMKPFQRRLVNLPRVMIRHMSYVISMKDHELPYGDWLTMVFEDFGVLLADKKGKEPKMYDYFEETFLIMCQLKRENRVWWIGSGENRRRDDEIDAPAEQAEMEEEAQNSGIDWEAMVDEAAVQGESGSDDQFFDGQVDVEEPVAEAPVVPAFPASPGDSINQQREQTPAGVDPSRPSGHIPDSVFLPLQAEFKRVRANRIQAKLEKAQAGNARLLALLQQAKSHPKP